MPNLTAWLVFVVFLFITHANFSSSSALKEAHDKQNEVYEKWMERMFGNANEILKDEILLTVERIRDDGKKEYVTGNFDLYKFVGEEVNSMPLKSVFEILQNWYFYIENLADQENEQGEQRKQFIEDERFFQLNIGGEDYTFGIRLQVKTKEILIIDEKGVAPAYKDIFKSFQGSTIGQNTIAKQLLEAANSPINQQPNWDTAMGSGNEELMYNMKMFSIISQVAEGARPSEDFYNIMRQASDEVIQKQNGENVIQKTEEYLQKKFYKTFSDMADDNDVRLYVLYRDFFSPVDKYGNLQLPLKKEKNPDKKNKIQNEMDDLIKEISEKLPEHSDEFFKKLQANVDKEGDLIKFLKKTCQLDTDDPNFNKENLVSAIRNLQKTPQSNDEEYANAKKDVERSLPIISKNFIKELVGKGSEYFKKLNENVGSVYDENVKGHEEGRIPGAGTLVRNLLKEVETNGEFSFFEFSKVAGFTEVRGLRPARELAIQLLPFVKTERFPPSDFEEGKGNEAANRISPKGTAIMDDVKEVVNNLVDKVCESGKQRKKRAGESCGIDDKVKLVEDSVKWEGNMLQFETVNDEGIKEFHEIKYPLDEMGSTKYFKENAASESEVSAKFGIGMGVYGTFASICSSVKQFMDGNYGQGALSAVQALHTIGGLTGLNEKLGQKIVEKSLDFAVEKFGFEKALEKLSEPLAEGLGKAGKIFSRFLGDIPFVGLGFDIYFITEDVKDLENKNSSTPKFLKVAHLILDVETTVLSLVETFVPEAEPFVEPLIIALSIIRMSIDDFYTDIKSELAKVKGKGFGAKVVAFFKGFGEGIADFFTLGLVNQINELNEQKEHDKQLFQNMSNPENYFNKTLAQKGDIDFNGGIMSQFGGFLSVTLNDDGSFTMELPEVYTGETPISIKKTIPLKKPAKDVVLGVGTVASPEYIHKEAKLWLLIPVKSYDIVQKFLGHNSSRYGTYYGNKYDNNFYAIQSTKSSSKMTHISMDNALESSLSGCQNNEFYQSLAKSILSDYHYDLYGQGGDDKFFLGPQSSHVLGNDGEDLYFIPPSGGKALIDNFALDEKMDTLYMNISYNDMSCYRQDWDLVVSYCESHAAYLKRWFIQGENHMYFRHINIITNDEIEISVTDTGISGNNYQTICNPISIDKSRSKIGVHLDLTDIEFVEVKRAVGSNFSDTIIGNNNDNLLVGGLGNDFISGEMGEDVYVVKKGDGVDTIDNFSSDKKNDTILFGVDYNDISVSRQLNNLLVFDSKAPSNTKLIMKFWFNGPNYQHTTFVSKDYITFLVVGNTKNLRKDAITIDLSKYKHGVTVNLQNPDLNSGIVISSEASRDVKLLLDSPYNDCLMGNIRNNIMTCSGGSDYLQGKNGSDTYIVKQSCRHVEILNDDEFKQYDLLLLNCSSSQIEMIVSGSDLILRCIFSHYHSLDVKLIKWFESSLYQHLMVKTLNQWTFLPPEKKEHFNSVIEPYQIETTESCNGQVQKFDFSKAPFQHVQRFQAKSSSCRYRVIGNSINNYIDPGPSDSYGYQTLTGGNGSDTYVFGHNYGVDNAIDNYATDGHYDHLLFQVIYDHINITQKDNDLVISSVSPNNSVNVTLLNYVRGKAYQHLLIHSSDGVFFQIKIVEYALVKEIVMLDYSKSNFSQIISALSAASLSNVRAIFGSQTAVNSIHGGIETMRIVGGQKNDKIIGGSFILGEDIVGLDGNDYINGEEGDDNILGGNGNDTLIGGTGNDVIYGGKGADAIDGGNGSDTVVFSGSGRNGTGIFVSLQIGRGWYADAEGDTYESIENILGSEYNDSLIGTDDDNVLRGYGGDDYIMPFGGLDVLQGGLDSDVYDMKNAYGLKVINNFATDKKMDTLLLSNVTYSQMCYFYNRDNLYLVTDFSNSNDTGAMRRAVLGEGLLEIKLLLWSSNATYQHLQVVFSDHHISPSDDLPDLGHQLKWITNELLNEKVLQVSSVNQTCVVLRVKFRSINQTVPLPLNTKLYYIHTDHNSTRQYPLKISGASSSAVVTVNNKLKQGVRQMFSVLLMSCNVSAAISPLTVATTLPNPPIDLKLSDLTFDGFTIHWTPPDNATDPNVFYYNYTIKYWMKAFPKIVHTVEYSELLFNKYTLSKLAPSTHYKVAIASRIYNTVGEFSPPIIVKTGYTLCLNFFLLSKHLHIERVEHNHHHKLVAYVYCDENYRLTGDKYFVCNGISLHPPKCVVIHCKMPSVESLKAFQTAGSCNLLDGDTVTWNCSKHYQTKDGKFQFNSTCNNGNWSPPLQPCVLSPACPNYPSFANGHANPPFAYRDETVTLTCDKYFTRVGPEKKICIIESSLRRKREHTGSWSLSEIPKQGDTTDFTSLQSAPHYYPPTEVKCVRYQCPMLLPQPHGTYSENGKFESGDKVTLTCDTGYFVRNDYYHPERVTLTCTKEGTWSVEQKTCKSVFKIKINTETFFYKVTGILEYAVPKWKYSLILDSSYRQAACDVLGGKKFQVALGLAVTCSLDYQLRDNPPLNSGVTNYWSGILTIVHDAKGDTEKVCVDNTGDAAFVCRHLGLGQYTASVFDVQSFESTKALLYIFFRGEMIDKHQSCSKMISCRATCQPLYLDDAVNTCEKTFEG